MSVRVSLRPRDLRLMSVSQYVFFVRIPGVCPPVMRIPECAAARIALHSAHYITILARGRRFAGAM